MESEQNYSQMFTSALLPFNYFSNSFYESYTFRNNIFQAIKIHMFYCGRYYSVRIASVISELDCWGSNTTY
jgi:hypothetical protein